MEFKEQSSKQVITRNFETYNNGYRYEIEVIGSSIEMKIYANKETALGDGSILEEKSSFHVGVISLKDGIRRVSAEGDINRHITIFEEFIKTL